MAAVGGYREPTDYDLAIYDRVCMGFPPVGPLTEAMQSASDAYDAFCEAHERECGVSISVGPARDPYGASCCDLDVGHDGPHEGRHPMVEGWRLRWRGGGLCAGDPLPIRDMQTIKDDGTVRDGG